MAKRFDTSDELNEGTSNLYFTQLRAIASKLTGYAKATSVRAIAATDSILVALGLVERLLDDKAPIASPTFTGSPAAPTPATGNNSTLIATTQFTTTAVNNLNTGINNSLALKQDKPTATNSVYGLSAGSSTGSDNTLIGYYSVLNITSASQNTAIGSQAGYFISSGQGNTMVGYKAGLKVSTGIQNVFIGTSAGFFSSASVSNNVVIGANAGNSMTSNNTVAIGFFAGYNNTANGHVAIGTQAGYNNKALYNTFVGNNAGYSCTTGTYNTAYGDNVQYSVTTGTNNTAHGANANSNTTTGSNNTALGSQSGGANTTGSNNTSLGVAAGPATNNLTNTTAVGYNVKPTQSDTVILGDTTNANVKVGIGTTAPTEKLQVSGIVYSTTGGFRFPDNTLQTTAFPGFQVVSSSIKSSVTGGTYTNGELQGTQPSGSAQGMKFCDNSYRYEYMTLAADTDGTTLGWIRTIKA